MPEACADPKSSWTQNFVIHVLTDFAIVILLTPLLKHLNIPRKQKTALVLVFAIGFSTSITSIMRFNSLVRISSSRDLTFGNASKATWSAGETNIGITCASQPARHPVLARLLPTLLSSALDTEGDPDKATGTGANTLVASR
jgi:hypothetical protein